MKKLLVLLLVFVLLGVCMISGCASSIEDTASETDGSQSTEESNDVQEADEGNEDKAEAESADDGKVYELKWYFAASDDHSTAVTNQKVIDEIYERTNGKVKITASNNGVLGTEAEVVDMLRQGTVAIMSTGTSTLSSFYEPIQVLSLPYVFEDVEHMHKYFDTDASKAMLDKIENDYGLVTMSTFSLGFRNVTVNDIAATKPEDLDGVKLRCMGAPVFEAATRALGASPVPLAFSELYFSLQTGVVDGQENPINVIYDQKFYEVQDYLIKTEHSLLVGINLFSKKVWDTLPEEYQQIILEVEKKYRPDSEELVEEQCEGYKEDLIAAGMEIIQPDKEAFIQHANDVIEETYGDNEEWMEIYKAIKSIK